MSRTLSRLELLENPIGSPQGRLVRYEGSLNDGLQLEKCPPEGEAEKDRSKRGEIDFIFGESGEEERDEGIQGVGMPLDTSQSFSADGQHLNSSKG